MAHFCQLVTHEDATKVFAISPRFDSIADAKAFHEQGKVSSTQPVWIGIYDDCAGFADHVCDIQLDGALGTPDYEPPCP